MEYIHDKKHPTWIPFFFFTEKNALPFSFCLSQWQNKIKDVKEEKVKNVKMKENV